MDVWHIFRRYKLNIDQDRIFDPIRKKWVHLTPEEIVRQKTIKFLIQRLKVPADKIIVERSLGTLGIPGSRRRIDIGILDADGALLAIIECKAEINIYDCSPYEQAQEYLHSLGTHYFFVIDNSSLVGFYYDYQQFLRMEAIPQYSELLSSDIRLE